MTLKKNTILTLYTKLGFYKYTKKLTVKDETQKKHLISGLKKQSPGHIVQSCPGA